MSGTVENLTLELLRAMRGDMERMRSDTESMRKDMATKDDMANIRSDLKSLAAYIASDMLIMRKDISDQVVGLRRAVIEYHSAVIGHGVLISSLEARLRRVEQHLNMPDMDMH
jgi:ribosomal protein S15P/S13E